MKYVILSFDDGRLDTYSNTFPILKENNLTATLNVVSDFILHSDRYHCFESAENKAMTIENIIECRDCGIEIALHGATHQNSVDDVLQNKKELGDMGIDTDNIGFASPFSELNEQNCAEIYKLVEKGELSYIRTGIQTRRMGFLYIAFSLINRVIKSKRLFWRLNKNLFNKTEKLPKLLRGVSVTRETTLKEIEFCIDKLGDGEAVIFILHSILPKDAPGYQKDRWAWDIERFQKLCRFLNKTDDLQVITTKQLLSVAEKG